MSETIPAQARNGGQRLICIILLPALLALALLALAACGSTSSTTRPPLVSTAVLAGRCAVGWEWTPDDTGSASGAFVPGPPPAGSATGDPSLAYRLTLANGGRSAADVGGFAVVFYDASGNELGSDQYLEASGIIVPGQGLSWTVIEDHTVRGYGDDPDQQLAQTAGIPPGAAMCAFVQWYTGSGS